MKRIFLILTSVGLTACATGPEPPARSPAFPPDNPLRQIQVPIGPKSDSSVKGMVTLKRLGDSDDSEGVRVSVQLEGASRGAHGVHFHEIPDCRSPDAKSAGGHFNPDDSEHGLPTAGEQHLGDLGNIVIGPDGSGTLQIDIADANLEPNDDYSLLNRALIVHQKPDQGTGQAGNAGARVACAEITLHEAAIAS